MCSVMKGSVAKVSQWRKRLDLRTSTAIFLHLYCHHRGGAKRSQQRCKKILSFSRDRMRRLDLRTSTAIFLHLHGDSKRGAKRSQQRCEKISSFSRDRMRRLDLRTSTAIFLHLHGDGNRGAKRSQQRCEKISSFSRDNMIVYEYKVPVGCTIPLHSPLSVPWKQAFDMESYSSNDRITTGKRLVMKGTDSCRSDEHVGNTVLPAPLKREESIKR